MEANVIIGIDHGGTGQTSANAGFNALNPMIEAGDIIYRNNTGAVRLPKGTARQNLSMNSQTLLPVWADPAVQGAYGELLDISFPENGLTQDGQSGYIEYTPSSFLKSLLTTEYLAPQTAYLMVFPNIGLDITEPATGPLASIKIALWTDVGTPDWNNQALARTITVKKNWPFQASFLTGSKLSDLSNSAATTFRFYIQNVDANNIRLMGYGDIIGVFYLPNGFI
jgi:hypothetical protein